MSLLFVSLLTSCKHQNNCCHCKRYINVHKHRLLFPKTLYSPFLVGAPFGYGYATNLSRHTYSRQRTWLMCQKQPIEITRTIKTNGGWMFDVEVDDNQQLSRHTVLLGKNLFEELADHTDSTPETVVITVFRYLIERGVALKNTQGVFDSSQFPINYFSVRQLFYFYPDCKEYLKESLASTTIK